MILNFQDDVGYVMSLLKLELQEKLVAQGHGTRERSKLIQSIDHEIIASASILVAGMYMEDYYVFVEKGVKASRIPYNRGSGRKTSKYIDALIRFWRYKRGLSFKEATSAAFATANKHKKEGMPTRSSFRHSKDGTRLGFVELTLEKFSKEVTKVLERRVGDKVEIAFTNILDSFGKEIIK